MIRQAGTAFSIAFMYPIVPSSFTEEVAGSLFFKQKQLLFII
jgi:hypothetical protein